MAKYKGKRSDSYARVSGERAMSGMMHEDPREMANLPREAKMEYYPSWRYLDGAYLDDSIRGIDDLNNEGERRVSKSMSKDIY